MKQQRFRFKQQLKQKQKIKLRYKDDDVQTDGPVLKKGWLKFLIFDPREGEELNNFFVNNAFFEEKKRKQLRPDEVHTGDEFGEIDIPDQFQFFFVLTSDQILVLSQRHNDLMKTQQIVYLNSIVDQNVNGKEQYEGGVEDQGNFKEGFCFKLNVANERLLVWILCSSDLNDKLGWMEKISSSKLRQQLISSPSSMNANEQSLESELSQSQNMLTSQIKSSSGGGAGGEGEDDSKMKDGYWIVLQDWSSCTLACGGGTQSLHRFCVPAQNGGKDCKGDAVETKPCNQEPCPQDSDELLQGGLGKDQVTQKVMPVKVKMVRISKRMKTYERCVLKESDMNVLREDLKAQGQIPQVQARVVMNNQTLAVYENDQLESVLFTQLLKDIKIIDYDLDKDNCLSIIDKKQEKRIVICGIQDKIKEKNEWVQAITFFRDNCQTPLQNAKGQIGSSDADNIIKEDPLLNLKKQEIDEELAEKKQEQNENNNDQQELEEEKLKNSLESVQKMAIDAMSQELKFEKRSEKEEKEREKRMEAEMRQKLEEMREKEECIKRNMRKSQQKALGNEGHKDIAAKIQEIKEGIRNMIISNREKHKEKLQVLRKISERKRQKENKEIQEIKMKVASEIVDGDKKGNKDTCYLQEQDQKETNCKTWYVDEIELRSCFKTQYCDMCCEKEFGENNIDLRIDCLAGCLKQENQKNNSDQNNANPQDPNSPNKEDCNAKKEGGNWVWVAEQNSVKA